MDFSNQAPQPEPSALGLRLPGAGMGVPSVGGIMQFRSLAQIQADERAADRAQAAVQNAQPYITGLASHIRTKWSEMKIAKLQTVDERLLQCLRQRNGQYDPDKLAIIKEQNAPETYMMLSSNKARAASSWIRDVIGGTGNDKPWQIQPTPNPDIPPERVQSAYEQMQMEMQHAASLGITPSPDELRQFIDARKEMVLNELREEAQAAADRMSDKMEDQLAEGGFHEEFDKFIDDFVTFPFAVMKGPVVRKRKTFKWVSGPQGSSLQVVDELLPTWSRVSPFMLYWSAGSSSPDDGDLIERHQLSRQALQSLIGVEGYSESAIRAVLDEYGRRGLQDWLWIDAARATAEGKHLSSVMNNPDGLIDALQFWGSVQGKLLVEWGMDPEQVEDPDMDYQVEAWLIGSWVIKAVINPDPLGRKPYFKASYEEVPGGWMGNAVMDLIRDCQDVCNAAARALVGNMGIASGPQVWVNVDRLPAGEKITSMYPWKMWQTTSDPMGSTAPPLDFFQPTSMASELMGIYEKFSVLADEYSGVPRYMTGDNPAGGAGRTASGMNMLMNNAGKAIKQVIANIDRNVIEKLISRLWYYNMTYSDDEDLKGDVKVVAVGARALIMKESAAQRRNELLQIALTSPVAQQIMGLDGAANLLREQVKTLDMNPDRIVPPPDVVKARAAIQQAELMRQQAMAAQQPQEQYEIQRGPDGEMQGLSVRRPPSGPGPVSHPNQNLLNGAPATDHFSPMRTH